MVSIIQRIKGKTMNRRDILDVLSDLLQIYNTNLLEQDASNNDVMKELQHQNKDYLESILTRLNDINEILTKLEEKLNAGD